MSQPETARGQEIMPAEHAEVPTLPGGWPVVGHGLRLLRAPLPFLKRQRAHGDVVRFRLGRRHAYLVNTPEVTRQLLAGRGHETTDPPLLEEMKLLAGHGLGTSEGDSQRRQRRLVQPVFHRERLARYTRTMREVALEQIASWRDGQAIAAHEHLRDIARATVCRCLFSADVRAEATREITHCLPIVIQGTAKRAYTPAEWIFRLPTPDNRRFAAAHRLIHGAVDRLIAQYRTEGVDHDDVLSMLLAARDEHTNEGMTDQQVHDEVLTLLSGTTETSSAAVLWAFYMLRHHPWAEQRVLAELNHVLGDRDPDFDDIPRLAYLDRVITETLRLFPPGWLISRSPVEDMRIGGYRIPAGATVFWSQYVLHRDPDSFTDPDVFDPDRWLPERATSIPPDAYLPFGLSGRMCISKDFALMIIPIVLATIARRWRLRPPINAPIRPIFRTVLHPEPVLVTLERRHRSRWLTPTN